MRQAAEGTMQLVIVSNGLRVISRGTTDGNALGLFGADETVRSLKKSANVQLVKSSVCTLSDGGALGV